MDRLMHLVPTIERKEAAIDYINEFHKYNSAINGVGGLDRYLDDYEGWLKKLENDRNRIATAEKVPAETYFLVRESDNRIVGMLNFRTELNKNLEQFGGNIGYSIRPTERRKGYNKVNLFLGLLRAQELGIKRIMLDCNVNNLGSDNTLKSLGGILERTELDPYDNEMTNVYWFDVDDCIDKYKDIYCPQIIKQINKEKRL